MSTQSLNFCVLTLSGRGVKQSELLLVEVILGFPKMESQFVPKKTRIADSFVFRHLKNGLLFAKTGWKKNSVFRTLRCCHRGTSLGGADVTIIKEQQKSMEGDIELINEHSAGE